VGQRGSAIPTSLSCSFEIDVFEASASRFAKASRGFRVGHVPKGHWDLVCRRVPKRHTVFAARRGCRTSQENLKGAQICAKADASFSQGVRL